MERLACMKRHPRRGCNSGMGRKPGTRARAARPAAATRSRVDKIPFPCVCLVKLHECFREILPGPIQGGSTGKTARPARGPPSIPDRPKLGAEGEGSEVFASDGVPAIK